MYIEAQPIGIMPPSDDDRMPLWKVINGDDWRLTTRLTLPNGTPATPKNSRITFALAGTRFSRHAYWTGSWNAGVEPVNNDGLVSIRIPDAVSVRLRRGVYSFSLTVSDIFKKNTQTRLAGNIQVEYEPTSPNHNIPYRHTQWGELAENANHETI